MLSFNVGVELGQLVVVCLLFPVVHLLARGRSGWRSVAAQLSLVGLFFGLLAAAGISFAWQAPAAGVLLLVAIFGARRFGYRKAVVGGGSTVIGLLALFWLVERVLGTPLLGGYLG